MLARAGRSLREVLGIAGRWARRHRKADMRKADLGKLLRSLLWTCWLAVTPLLLWGQGRDAEDPLRRAAERIAPDYEELAEVALRDPLAAVRDVQRELEAEALAREKRVQLLHLRGLIEQRALMYQESLATLREALRLAGELGDDHRVGHVLNGIGGVFWMMGDNEHGVEVLEQALEAFERAGDTARLRMGLNNLGLLYEELGQLEKARESLLRALDLGEEEADPLDMLHTQQNLGLYYLAKQEGQRALELFRRALSYSEELGLADKAAAQHLGMARAYGLLGKSETALLHCRSALRLAREGVAGAVELDALRELSNCLETLGRAGEALGVLREYVDKMNRQQRSAMDPVNLRERQLLLAELGLVTTPQRGSSTPGMFLGFAVLGMLAAGMAGGGCWWLRRRDRREHQRLRHEMRNQLSGIIGMASLLQESPLGGTEARYVATLREAGDRLLGLTDEWGRLQKGTAKAASGEETPSARDEASPTEADPAGQQPILLMMEDAFQQDTLRAFMESRGLAIRFGGVEDALEKSARDSSGEGLRLLIVDSASMRLHGPAVRRVAARQRTYRLGILWVVGREERKGRLTLPESAVVQTIDWPLRRHELAAVLATLLHRVGMHETARLFSNHAGSRLRWRIRAGG